VPDTKGPPQVLLSVPISGSMIQVIPLADDDTVPKPTNIAAAAATNTNLLMTFSLTKALAFIDFQPRIVLLIIDRIERRIRRYNQRLWSACRSDQRHSVPFDLSI
jgi:hypothetical protein